MTRAIIAVTALVLLHSAVAAEDKSRESPPPPKKLASELYDMTERWQFLFAMEQRLVIAKARKNLGPAAADGDIMLSFEAQAREPGCYGFTFVRVDRWDRVYEARIITVNVREGAKNSKQMAVSPDLLSNQANLSVAPGEKFTVEWKYNPGGEGDPGGWRLLKTSFSKKPQPLPGFEGVRGE